MVAFKIQTDNKTNTSLFPFLFITVLEILENFKNQEGKHRNYDVEVM